jgi:hypothetical protein
MKALDPPIVILRCQRARPGEPLHLDTKKLGRIHGSGHRITGRQPGAVRAALVSPSSRELRGHGPSCAAGAAAE